MGGTPTGEVIEHRIVVTAAPSAVYRALTNADTLIRWFPTAAESDPRPGGRYAFTFEFEREPQRNHTRRGVFRDVVADHRLAYTWPGVNDGDTLVEFHLAPIGDGTDVRLVHSGWGDGARAQTARKSHAEGWAFFLGNLKAYLERGEDLRATANGMRVAAGR